MGFWAQHENILSADRIKELLVGLPEGQKLPPSAIQGGVGGGWSLLSALPLTNSAVVTQRTNAGAGTILDLYTPQGMQLYFSGLGSAYIGLSLNTATLSPIKDFALEFECNIGISSSYIGAGVYFNSSPQRQFNFKLDYASLALACNMVNITNANPLSPPNVSSSVYNASLSGMSFPGTNTWFKLRFEVVDSLYRFYINDQPIVQFFAQLVGTTHGFSSVNFSSGVLQPFVYAGTQTNAQFNSIYFRNFAIYQR